MISKTFKAETDYDYDLDIYSITSCEDFDFKRSLEIEEGIILDFDINDIPISIEILDISERLNLNKKQVQSSNAHMKVKSSKDILEVCITFYVKIQEREISETIDSKIVNSYNIPEMEYITV
ncbi:DUF2283 domain-containing protein [Methanobrevibacter sp.]|uniref:DUF2283 domain-containing protein n=1 Tax=Methanobrevibacter sp. TaxID=66852 RepID=UPI003867D3F8